MLPARDNVYMEVEDRLRRRSTRRSHDVEPLGFQYGAQRAADQEHRREQRFDNRLIQLP